MQKHVKAAYITPIMAILALILFLFSWACSAPLPFLGSTATPTQTLTSTITNTPLPTGTPTLTPSPTPYPTSTQLPIQEPDFVPPPVGVQAQFGKGAMWNMDISPDGKTLALATGRGVYLYSLPDLTQLNYVATIGEATSADFSPNGDSIAIGTSWGYVMIFSLSGLSGEPQHLILSEDPLSDYHITIYDVLFSSDSSNLYAATDQGRIEIYDIASEKLIDRIVLGNKGISKILISPDNRYLYFNTADGKIGKWDLNQGQIANIIEDMSPFSPLALSPDGSRLIMRRSDYSVTFWNTLSSSSYFDLPLDEEQGQASSFSFSPAGSKLALGFYDGSLKLIDPNTGTTLAEGFVSYSNIWGIEFLPDSDNIVVFSFDGTVSIFNLYSGQLIKEITGFISFDYRNTVITDSNEFYFHDYAGRIIGWDLFQQSKIYEKGFTKYPASIMALSQDKKLVALELDGHIFTYNFANPENVQYLNYIFPNVLQVAYAPNGEFLSILDEQDGLTLWSLNPLQKALTIPNSSEKFLAFCFSPDSETIATANESGVVNEWSARSGEKLSEWKEDNYTGYTVTYSNDGSLLAIGDNFQHVYLWDPQSMEIKQRLFTNASNIYLLKFSPNGKFIAAAAGIPTPNAAESLCIVIWNVETGDIIDIIRDQNNYISSIGFLSDGHSLAAASTDGTVMIYSLPINAID